MKKKLLGTVITVGLIFISYSGHTSTSSEYSPMTCPGGYVGPCIPVIMPPHY